MHAKVLLVDDSDLLVTSANFTHHGQAVNVEYGLRLSGEPARRTAVFFKAIEEQGILIESS
jgi:phosphatidylserine/phosphatidylglycerophosphate/cardiolipin synthase-like enzyme